jgi:hypothetical protein
VTRDIGASVAMVGAFLALIAVGEIPTVRAWSSWISAHRAALLAPALGATGTGLVVMVWGWAVASMEYGRPMTESEARQFMARPRVVPGHQSLRAGTFRGTALGRTMDRPAEWSFAEMKTAWHDGTWWASRGMRRKFAIASGGTLLVLGGFLVALVLSEPPAVKVLIAATVTYAIVRLSVGFIRA